MDEAWLRERAYPLIRGAAEFYRHFPNFKKGDDGRYHIYHVNSGESNWNTADTPYETSCMEIIFPLAIRASEVLDMDAELRPVWQEISEHLPESRGGRGGRGGGNRPFGAFVYGGPGAIEPLGEERELKSRFLSFTRLGSFIDDPGIGGAEIFRNRLRLREGPGAIDAEHIAGLSSGVHSSLLDSSPPTPAGEPVLRLFSTWPKSWDATFTLLGRGAFVVSSAQRGGAIPWVEIRSSAGERCRVQNPWPGKAVTLRRGGAGGEKLSGETLEFTTAKGETAVLTPEEAAPGAVAVPE